MFVTEEEEDQEIRMMEQSFERILLFFIAVFQWFASLLRGGRQTIDKTSPPTPTPSVYGENYKTKFLLTFREECGAVDWNSNIDAIVRDPKLLSDALKEEGNEYEKKWRSQILIENTPRGNVIMFYDLYKRAFSYYCDNSVIPYDIMNAVAMKYVMVFRCRDFFIDSQIVPKSATPIEENHDKNEEIKTNVPFKNMDRKAFVKLKQYNTATKKVGVLPNDDKVINCFQHLGASRNWTPISKRAKANPLNGFQTDIMPASNNNNRLSYLDYKKQMNQ